MPNHEVVWYEGVADPGCPNGARGDAVAGWFKCRSGVEVPVIVGCDGRVYRLHPGRSLDAMVIAQLLARRVGTAGPF